MPAPIPIEEMRYFKFGTDKAHIASYIYNEIVILALCGKGELMGNATAIDNPTPSDICKRCQKIAEKKQ